MEPLTSPHRCEGCLRKSQSIAELERRISNLYWIRNEEMLLDSVVTLGAGPPASSGELESTFPVIGAAPTALVSAAPASVSLPPPKDTPAPTRLPTSVLPLRL